MPTPIDQFDYDLPEELIAQYPLMRRSDARLMLVDRRQQTIGHFHIRDLPELLAPGDRLVLNDTRVVPASLVGYRTSTSGRWQGLFLSADEHGLWRILGKTRGKLSPGETVTLLDRAAEPAHRLRLIEKRDGGVWIAAPEPKEEPLAILERVGRVPLPHYIRGGEMEPRDTRQYQTVFAQHPGAVAAPTAGLHFTPELLEQIRSRGIGITRVTLHVGMGTFRPVSTATLEEHQMHAEWMRLTPQAAGELQACRASGHRIVAVGTTAMRSLETAARGGSIEPVTGETDLFIRPGFEFRAVDALLTNFHLPRSTLLVLVRTFGGDGLMRQAYREAIAQEYRFYSYGDAMLII